MSGARRITRQKIFRPRSEIGTRNLTVWLYLRRYEQQFRTAIHLPSSLGTLQILIVSIPRLPIGGIFLGKPGSGPNAHRFPHHCAPGPAL